MKSVLSKKCDHLFRLLTERKVSEGFDGRGAYEKVHLIFFCQRCLSIVAKREKIYYEEEDRK